MTQLWRVGIRGKQRDNIDLPLLVQAVIALGRQLSGEQSRRGPTVGRPDRDDLDPYEERR
jgi:hypothetical protein